MKTILLVEDNREIREILDIFLTAEGFTVHSFETVKEFKERELNITPNLYLFDVMLPDGSGIDLCNEIQNKSEGPSIPVVIMSANARIDQLKNICNPDDFISKPFDLTNFVDRINLIIDKKN